MDKMFSIDKDTATVYTDSHENWIENDSFFTNMFEAMRVKYPSMYVVLEGKFENQVLVIKKLQGIVEKWTFGRPETIFIAMTGEPMEEVKPTPKSKFTKTEVQSGADTE